MLHLMWLSRVGAIVKERRYSLSGLVFFHSNDFRYLSLPSARAQLWPRSAQAPNHRHPQKQWTSPVRFWLLSSRPVTFTMKEPACSTVDFFGVKKCADVLLLMHIIENEFP